VRDSERERERGGGREKNITERKKYKGKREKEGKMAGR